ncbi:MAG TPA: hypothetical protein VFO65_06155 [Acidimicrobiales bacterium]|nr:hypothetical protein [Acidimicrobiales bacterium]
MTPWWAAVAPAEATVDCGRAAHRLRWAAGRLELVDHDGDAERVMGVLGSDLPACVRVKAAWEARAADVGLVTLGRRPGEADLGLGRDGAAAVAPPAPAPGAPPAEAAGRRRDDLLALLSLPAAMIDRLVLGVFADAADRWADEEFRRVHGLRLGAAVTARATPALRRLGAELAGGGPVEVQCAPAGPGEGPEVEARRAAGGVRVTATLPLGWVASVWGAGISEPDGRFVLALAPGGDLEVEVAAWEPLEVGRWRAVGRLARLARDGDGPLRLVAATAPVGGERGGAPPP